MFSGKNLLCTQCHSVGKTKRKMPGSVFIELVLWFCFIIPGLIYSLWRHSAVKKVCSSCGSEAIIAVDSPRAQEIIKSKAS